MLKPSVSLNVSFNVINSGGLIIVTLLLAVVGMPVAGNVLNVPTDSKIGTLASSHLLLGKLQGDTPPVIDGAEKPELIPDALAYTVLFRSLCVAPDADETERERAQSLSEHLASDKEQAPALIEAAEQFRKKVKDLDLQVAEIKDKNWPNPSSESMDRLAQLQTYKEKLVEESIELLSKKLGIKSALKLNDKVKKGFKAKLKLFPSPMSFSGHRHISLYDASPSIVPAVLRSPVKPSSKVDPSLSHSQGTMYGWVTYTDSWSSWSRTFGCGVTEDNYNTWGHQYWIKCSITSPNGRSSTATSYTGSSYASVTVSLPWDDNDLGEFLVVSEHWWRCPYIGSAFPYAISQKRVRIGASLACYKFAFVDPSAPICVYTVTDACNCKCKSAEIRFDPKGLNCSLNRFLIDKVKWRQPEGEAVQCQDPGVAKISPIVCNDCFDIGIVQ